jgi:hypothetical protein
MALEKRRREEMASEVNNWKLLGRIMGHQCLTVNESF